MQSGDSEDDESWAPPYAAVLSVQTAMSLQSPYPSQSRSTAYPHPSRSLLAVSVLDPDMVNEQARRREPFLAAAAAEYGIANGDGDSDSIQRSGKSKRSKENEAVQGDEWTCSKCETSNDGMESQCTNCGARYAPPVAVLGWGNAAFATSFKNKWKCETCLAFNGNEVDTCASCEVPRAVGNGGGGTTATTAATTTSANGFSFGGGTEVTGATTATTAATKTSAIGANGFSFGGSVPSSTTTSVEGFSFRAPAPAAKSTATSSSIAPVTTGGFSFGAASAAVAPATASTVTSTATSSSAPVTTGRFSFDAAPATASTATSTLMSSSVPVTTGVFVVGTPPVAVASTTASTAANDDNNETSSGLVLGDSGSTPDSVSNMRASSKESKKKTQSADKADDENVAN